MQSFPKWAERFLRTICPDHVVDQIIGDLVEIYQHDIKHHGTQKARWRLIIAVLRFFRPGILVRNKLSISPNQGAMVHHYFKTTLRHFVKSKLNFSFKLLGLCFTLTSLLVIVLYVSYQLSFDKFHTDYQNIYRVNSQWRENGEMAKYALVPTGVGPMLKTEFPEVREYARMGFPGRYQVSVNNKSFHTEGIAEADSSIFDVLSFSFLRGEKIALQQPGSIVLTESLAQQMFDEADPVGEAITLVDKAGLSLHVTGIIKDLPSNTHLNIRALVSFGSLSDSSYVPAGPWEISIDGSTVLYLRLRDGTDADEFVSKVSPAVRQRITRNESGLEKEYGILLQPLKNLYLDKPIYAEFFAKGNMVYVFVFAVLGLFLVIISGINYINLTVADFHKRLKEIGVRKVMGALRRQIAFQVIFEACLVVVLSLIISVCALYLLFPEVKQSLDPNLRFAMLTKPEVVGTLAVVTTALIILSTLYPAYQLAIKSPIENMKSIGKAGGHAKISRALLISQFGISIICITSTLVIGQQLRFIQERNPGYDRQNLIVAYMPDQYPTEKIQVIKDEFANVPGVEAVSFSTFRIAGAGYYRDWYRVEIDGEIKRMMLNEVFFDHDFFRATGIALVAGREFDAQRATDSHEAFIVNETAVRHFGWKDALGKRISYGYDETDGEKWEGVIVGVVKDFNVYSLHKKIEPLVMRLPWSDWPGACVHIRINGPLDETIARIQKKYTEILPGFILHYSVVDELYSNQYSNERKAYTALQFCTWIIVIISCLGIFSLSLYLSVAKTKEFGIRKVLGATSKQISVLHTGKFVKIALIANVVAIPGAWIASEQWLEQFAYKTEVSGFLFVAVTGISLFLVILSAGYSSWKAGVMNPVDVIKSE